MRRGLFHLCMAPSRAALVAAVVLQLCCVALAAPCSAAGQEALPASVTDRVLALSYKYHLAEQEAQSLMQAFEKAMRKGAPLDPLVRKMEEGLAKNVPSARIVVVIDDKTSRFEVFAEIVKGREPAVGKRSHYLERMEEISSMGVAIEEIRSHILGAPGRPLDQVLNALESKVALCRAGVPDKAADEVMAAGLATGYFKTPAFDLALVARAATERGAPPDMVGRISRDVAAGRLALQSAARKMGVDYNAAVAAKGRSGSVINNAQQKQGSGAGTGPGSGSGGHGGGSGNGGSGGGSGGGGSGGGGSGGGGRN